MRHTNIRYWATVDAKGVIRIEYRLRDILDLTPGGFPGIKGQVYNFFATVLGGYYHNNGMAYPGEIETCKRGLSGSQLGGQR